METRMDGMTTSVRFLQEENHRLRQQNENLKEELSYLQKCFKSIRGLQRAITRLDTKSDLMPLLDRILYEALRVVDAIDGSLMLIDQETQELVFVVVRGELQEQLQNYRMPYNQGIAGWVVTHQEPTISNDITQDKRFYDAIDQTFHFSTRSLLCVPLVSRGKILGVIETINKFSGFPFDERDIEMLSTWASIAALTIDLVDLESEQTDST